MTEFALVGHPQAEPFIPWVGGKRRFHAEISRLMPERVNTYWEPFLGGGWLFYAIEPTLKKKAMLNDKNPSLVLTYDAVQNDVENLIDLLRKHAIEHSKDRIGWYKKMRDIQRTIGEGTSTIQTAARFIYLIQTSYKNMWSVDKQGRFSNTIGDKTGNNICDADTLRAASRALQSAKIHYGEFYDYLTPPSRKVGYDEFGTGRFPETGDFIFCDPPYDECYTRYQDAGFNKDHQRILRDKVKLWRVMGANVMVFNSDTPYIRELYSDTHHFTIHPVSCRHQIININAGAPGDVEQVIITTY